MVVLTPCEQASIRYLIIKDSNITIYFTKYDDLLILMNVGDKLENSPESSLTYVIDHSTEDSSIYHAGIDKSYDEDGHYHFRRKDNDPLTQEDTCLLLKTLDEYQLLTPIESLVLTSRIQEIWESKNNSPPQATISNLTTVSNLNRFSILSSHAIYNKRKGVVDDCIQETQENKRYR
ncbi:hypothetical protein ACNVED_05870 [Legionella sp. D16C41]|uniref:hypothetical protein n=1 Tax=Legionella sp. D16C41 TaxID=3402688 RepID=UPI003AF7D7E3